MVLRELPTEIRRTIHDKAKDLDGASTAKLADQYFDRNGKPIHKATNNPVNVVTNTPERTEPEDEDDVNAIGNRFPRRKQTPRGWHAQTANNQNTNKGWHAPTANKQREQRQQGPPAGRNQYSSRPRPPGAPPNNSKRTHTGTPTVKQSKLCYWHSSFGKDAYTCEDGCDKFANWKAGKAQAGRHT